VKRTISILLALMLALSVSLMTAMPAMAGAPTAALTTPGAGIDGIAGAPAGSGTEAGVHTIVVTDATASTLTGNVVESASAAGTIATDLAGDETLSVTIAGEAITTAALAAATADVTTLAAVATDIQTKINAATTVADVTVSVVDPGGVSNGYFVITVDDAGVNNSMTTQVTGTNGGETETGLGGVDPVAGTDANAVDTFAAAPGSNGLWVADPAYGNGGATMTIAHSPAAGTASTLLGLEALVEAANAFINGVTLGASVALAAGTAVVTVSAGTAGYLAVTGNATMVAGTTNELTVTAYDDADNVATAYAGAKNLTFAGPGVAADGTNPTVEGVNIGTATAVNFTAGVSDGGAATLIAYKVEVTTVDVDDGTINSTGHGLGLTVTVGGIDHYAVTAITSPVGVSVPFNVTIQAQDVFNNNIVAGAENINITFGITDTGATPTTTTTTNGTATVGMTMMLNVGGQTITFTGVTSGKTGTSNTFFVAAFSGGGAGGVAPPSSSGEGSMNIHYFLDADGRATVVITLTSTDGLVIINIPSGTQAFDAQGNPLFNIRIVALSTPPPPPGYVMVGRAYDCLPDGATFQPAMALTFSYYESHIPTGASEEDLVLAYWDGEQWVNLPTTVDAAANTATADVAHFTPFALLIEAPAGGAPPEEAPPEEAPPEEAPAEAEPLNIWIIVGIIAAVIVVGLIVFMLVRRRA
jgi:hypothetical protein